MPLRAPETCNNWSEVSKACTGSLRSLANQVSKDFRCILVCHEPPNDIPDLEKLDIVTVNFQIPKNDNEYKKDKGMKILRGLQHLQNLPTSYSMVLDADDRLHKDFVTYICANESESGWVIDKGYVYPGGLFARSHNGNFERLCGSTIITKNVHDNNDTSVLIGHTEARTHFEKMETPLKQVPFFAAVKIVGYGDNLTETLFVKSETIKRTLKKTLQLRLVSKRFKKNFSL